MVTEVAPPRPRLPTDNPCTILPRTRSTLIRTTPLRARTLKILSISARVTAPLGRRASRSCSPTVDHPTVIRPVKPVRPIRLNPPPPTPSIIPHPDDLLAIPQPPPPPPPPVVVIEPAPSRSIQAEMYLVSWIPILVAKDLPVMAARLMPLGCHPRTFKSRALQLDG